MAFPKETGQYILDTDVSNFGLGRVLSQIQNNVEHVVAYVAIGRYIGYTGYGGGDLHILIRMAHKVPRGVNQSGRSFQ